jgi:WhiB family redox-sensing transcriptional regulator
VLEVYDRLLRGDDLPTLAELFMPRPAWMRDALCKEHPEVEFYIGQGGDPEPAKDVCARCAVREECRAWALANDELYGIWGGLSAVERLRLLGRRRAA